MDYEKIAQEFLRIKARKGKLSYADEMLYMEGIVDILDAISNVEAPLLFKLFSIREAVENAVEAKEVDDTKEL